MFYGSRKGQRRCEAICAISRQTLEQMAQRTLIERFTQTP
jgi:hypothetical protein